MDMDTRKQQVLRAIVSLYALEGEPIGSNSLNQYLDIAVSSATLRNDMVALTRLGLLEQPHPSAGRVPSTAGYRYYLDNLITNVDELNTQEKNIIDGIFDQLDIDPEQLAQGSAKALSDLLGYTVIATTPKAEDLRIAHYKLVQTGKFSVAILAVTSAGGVLTRVARTRYPITAQEHTVLTKLINGELCFVSASEVTTQTLALIARGLQESAENVWPIIMAAQALLNKAGQPQTFIEGMKNLVSWHELSNDLPQIIELFADTTKTQQLVIPETGHTTVMLGEDFPDKAFSGLAIMSKRYLAGGGLSGAIAIVGPSRMPYKKMMATLEYFALKIGQIMSGNC